MEEEKTEMAIDCFLLAGRIMMESGAETYRVEDTMLRMARSQNMLEAQSYVTPTGIIFSMGKKQPTRITSISTRITDLQRVVLVNDISRKLTSEEITLEQAFEELKNIEKTNYFLPISLQVLAASLTSSCFLLIFNGNSNDILATFIAGGVGLYIVTIIHNITGVKFFSEFLGAVSVGIIASVSVYLGIGEEIDRIIISSVMPLVPGLTITNAVRDLMAGHFTAGMAKGAEAFLTAFAIGSGIALIVAF